MNKLDKEFFLETRRTVSSYLEYIFRSSIESGEVVRHWTFVVYKP